MTPRRTAYGISALAVVVAASTVTVPYVEARPGSARAIEELVTLDTTTTPIEGTYDLLTIRFATPSIAEAVLIWADPDRQLEPRAVAVPPGVDPDRYRELQRTQFSRAFRTAVGVGARAAGLEAVVRTRPVVFGIVPDGPADGLLDVGDVLRAVDGEPVEDAAALVAALGRRDGPGPVELDVLRGDELRTVVVTTAALPGLDQPGLGIQVDTIAEEVELPFDAELGQTSIGGPSAGMMIALTTYDLLAEEDLAAGRTIAGTGTIDADGVVGEIGVISEKVTAARSAGVDLLLVPASQLGAALEAADGAVEVVGVATLDEAIELLRLGRA